MLIDTGGDVEVQYSTVFDSALMSAPFITFITTAVDVLGVLIYFYIARIIL